MSKNYKFISIFIYNNGPRPIILRLKRRTLSQKVIQLTSSKPQQRSKRPKTQNHPKIKHVASNVKKLDKYRKSDPKQSTTAKEIALSPRKPNVA